MRDDAAQAAAVSGTEIVLGREPFTVRRTARWHECDPAGVVFVGNFTGYLLSAAGLFKQHLKVGGRGGPADRREYHTPGKAMSLVFLSSLWPDDVFDIELFVGEVRTHTSDVLAMAGRVDDGLPVFMGRITSIYVSPQDRRKTVPIPDDVRAIYERYRARNPAPERLIAEVGR